MTRIHLFEPERTSDDVTRRPHGGAAEAGMLDFSVSLNPLGPPDSLARALTLENVTRYPEPHSETLARLLAERYVVEPEQVLVTNGACEAIDLIMATTAARRVVVLAPAFTEYEDAARAWGRYVETVIAGPENDFRWNFDALEVSRDDLVVVGNPASPTGVLSQIPELDATLVVDETFLDFVEEGPSLVGRPNTLVVRSFTKTFACPGVRLGYVVGDVDALRARQPAWSVSRIAQAVGEAVLGESDYLAFSRRFVSERREELFEQLQSLEGVKVYPSAANFLLLRIDNAAAVAARLHERGIVVRVCDSFTGLERDKYLRVAVRKRSENQRLVEALDASR